MREATILTEATPSEALLTEEESNETENVLAFLALALLNSLDGGTITADVETADLASGWTGIAVALAYLHKAGLVREDSVHQAIEKAVEDKDRYPGSGLFSGPLGLAWATSHLRNRMGIDVAADTAGIDERVMESLYAAGPAVEYDLASGLTGIGVYAMERKDDSFGREAIPLVADALLLNLRDSEDGGLRWFTPNREREPRCDHPYLTRQIGVAHGSVGALTMLCQARDHLKDDFALEEIISDVWGWIDRQITEEEKGRNSARFTLEWRSGDLGIAGALTTACEAYPGLGAKAVTDRLFGVQSRLVTDGAPILGHSLLRGSAGVALTLGSAYARTGRPELRAGARTAHASLMRALANTESVDLRLDSPSTPIPEQRPGPGLFRGAAGIALTLLDLVRPGRSDWTSIMMLPPADS